MSRRPRRVTVSPPAVPDAPPSPLPTPPAPPGAPPAVPGTSPSSFRRPSRVTLAWPIFKRLTVSFPASPCPLRYPAGSAPAPDRELFAQGTYEPAREGGVVCAGHVRCCRERADGRPERAALGGHPHRPLRRTRPSPLDPGVTAGRP